MVIYLCRIKYENAVKKFVN